MNQPQLPIRDVYTLREAACLWCSEDPVAVTGVISDMQQEVELRMQLAIEAGTLKVAKFITAPEYDPRWVDGEEGVQVPEVPLWEEMLLTRDDLFQWADRNGYVPPFLDPNQAEKQPSQIANPRLSGGYTTPKLELLLETLAEFYEKGSSPTEAQLRAWHATKKLGGEEVSASATREIFRILNPPDRHDGGRKKKLDDGE